MKEFHVKSLVGMKAETTNYGEGKQQSPSENDPNLEHVPKRSDDPA